MRPDNLCVSEWNLFEDNRLFCWLGWCSSCSGKRQSQAKTAGIDRSVGLVGAVETAAIDCQFTWLVQLRQLHPLPFPSAVRSDSVRRPIGFRPPSDRIPFAVRLDSVRCTTIEA